MSVDAGIIHSVEKHGRKNRMSDEKYEELVQSAHQLALRDPAGYNMRVALLAALGYAFCWLFVGLFVAITAFFVGLAISSRAHYIGLKGAIIFGALAFILVKAMWVKLPPLEGRRITREEAPKLFEVLAEISGKLKTRIDTVVVIEDFNAAIEQRPRLGLLGFNENVLHLGIPYLITMTPEQFRSTLAHEMGHLSGNHGTFGTAIYCLRESWSRVLDELREAGGFVYAIFYVFANWYMPIFQAYTFSLARRHEEDADLSAMEIVGPKVMAQKFVRTSLNVHYLQKHFWERISDLPKTQKEPPKDLYGQMVTELRHIQISPQDAKEWLTEALRQKSDLLDPHPSTYDRIKVLQCAELDPDRLMQEGPPADLLSVPKNAADEFLGRELVDQIAHESSTDYYNVVKEWWEEKHDEYEQARQDYNELLEKQKTQELSKDEIHSLYSACADLHGMSEAAPIARDAIERFPNECWPYAALAYEMLSNKDEAGVALMERAIANQQLFTPLGLEALIGFYEQTGNDQKVQEYSARMSEYADLKELADEEREQVRETDCFAQHDLPPEFVAHLREQLSGYNDIDRVYLARLECKHMPQYPHYVIAVKPTFDLGGNERNAELEMALYTHLNTVFDESYRITLIDGFRKKIEEKIKAVPEAALYSKAEAKKR